MDRTYRTDRDDGRFLTTMGLCHQLLARAESRLRYQPGAIPDGRGAWRASVRERLADLLALPPAGAEAPPPRLLNSQPREGYRLERWECYPEPWSVVPYLVLVPDGVDSDHPAPAVMCFPGSATSKELLAGEPETRPEQPARPHAGHNRMALWYVQTGMIAVAVENPGIGELDEAPNGVQPNSGREKLSADLMQIGRSYVGLSVLQKLHILGWLRGQPMVDPSRIALSGHSLGTEPALCMAVLEPDIAALVFNDFLCHPRQRQVVTALPQDGRWSLVDPLWHLVPGVFQWFDLPDLVCSLAPMPLIMTEGGAREHLDLVRTAYAEASASDSLAVHHYPKFADPQARIHDRDSIPDGLTMEEYFTYANVDVPNHYFKEEAAVPWLREVLGL